MLQYDLGELGLNRKEAQVYLSLLELGEASLQRISEKSLIKRTTLYDVIASLKEKSLLGVTTKKGKRYFFAEDPRKIENQLERKRAKLKIILPELLSMANLIYKKPKIQYFEGIEGIKEVYRDTLNFPRQEILAWVSTEAVEFFDINWLWDFYVLKRAEKRIWSRLIAPNNDYMKKVKGHDEKHLRNTKFITMNSLPFEVEINLYGNDHVGIMSFKEQLGLIIQSKKIFNTLKSIFETNWELLK